MLAASWRTLYPISENNFLVFKILYFVEDLWAYQDLFSSLKVCLFVKINESHQKVMVSGVVPTVCHVFLILIVAVS